jgi:hypothetical protein
MHVEYPNETKIIKKNVKDHRSNISDKSGPLVPLYNQNNMIEMWADNRQQRWKRKETEK